VVRAWKSTYKRHGMRPWLAALAVDPGQLQTNITDSKRREDFGAFLDDLLAAQPPDKEIQVILDNYFTHKKKEDWLAKDEGRLPFHCTPTSASWLNQVEIVFSLLTRKRLRGARFQNKVQLSEAMAAFVRNPHANAQPFRWRKREVKGSQLRNTIINLCN
jgi:transposase